MPIISPTAISPHRIGDKSWSSYCTQQGVTELIAYVEDLATPLSTTQKANLVTFVKALKTGLSISLLSEAFDIMYIGGGETQETSLKNLISDAFHASLQGTPNPGWVAFKGFKGDGANGWLSTGWDNLNNGSAYTLNSASFGIYSRTDKIETTAEMGAEHGSGSRNSILTRFNSNNNQAMLNSRVLSIYGQTLDSRGMFIASRTASDALALYHNGVLVGSGTTAAASLISEDWALLGINDDGTVDSFSTRQTAFFFTGKGFTLEEVQVITNAFEAYMTANNTEVNMVQYRVDEDISEVDKGIVRIHDLINDDARNCVWGITRSNTLYNHVFKMNKDTGSITRVRIDEAGKCIGMGLCWGDDGYLYGAIQQESTNAILVRVNPDTMALKFYYHDSVAYLGSSLVYRDGYVYVGCYDETYGKIIKVNVTTEDYSEITPTEHTNIYWAAIDDTYIWFNGLNSVSGNTEIIKIDESDNITKYDLGVANGAGAEISNDGTYVWVGSNNVAQIIRFRISDNDITITNLTYCPRLNMTVGDNLWMHGSGGTYFIFSKATLTVLYTYLIPNVTYGHGFTHDGVRAWAGAWMDECYIERIPIVTED